MAWLLGICEFLEFMATPLGLTVSLWISLYYFAAQSLNLNLWLSALLPGIVAIDLYFFLKQID